MNHFLRMKTPRRRLAARIQTKPLAHRPLRAGTPRGPRLLPRDERGLTEPPGVVVRGLRVAFPNPRVAPPTIDLDLDHMPGRPARRYCVGGAFAMSMHLAWRDVGFAPPIIIAGQLRVANPRLNHDEAFHFATSLVDANDAGEFETAWLLLEHALSHNPHKVNYHALVPRPF